MQFPILDSAELRQKIESLDLTMPLRKCMDKEEGYGWDGVTARRMERDYKRFLFLTVTRPEPIVPTKEIDKLWHAHILDTKAYVVDCETLFGGFLHHYPYFGLRGEEDKQNLDAAFSVTNQIWKEMFRDPHEERVNALPLGADCSSCGAGSCGGAGCVNSSCSGDGVRLTSGISSQCTGGRCSGDGECSKCGTRQLSTSEAVRLAFAAMIPPVLSVF